MESRKRRPEDEETTAVEARPLQAEMSRFPPGTVSLSSLLHRIGRLPPEKAAEIGGEAAAGLAAIHRQGILHRDLRPANLTIDDRGRARITGGGDAVPAEPVRDAADGSGTPSYLAPEQLAGGDASIQSDLYALGLILYELFTGRPAFAAEPGRREAEPMPPSRRVPGLDRAVDRLILRCLEADPRRRPTSAEAVAAALEEVLKTLRAAESETIAGWRPAPGLDLPRRPHWVMEKKLGEGGFGDVWLATHRRSGERRVFKFCYEARTLRALQREITLFRLLKEELGERDDITRIRGWNFERAPYFIASEYIEGGSLLDWSEAQGGLGRVALETRLEIVAQVAEALAAAHSVGVLHTDVKPGNILITAGRDGSPRVRLTDFGIGLVTDRERLIEAGITVLGMTRTTAEPSSSGAGTRLYMAPELLEGKAATVQADIYALGVILYQLVVGDFTRTLAPGWRRDVEDELLREDVAAAVDGSPRRRYGNARRLAERLRSLDSRRADRQAERRQREARRRERQEAEQAMAALARARRRRQMALLAAAVLAVFAAAMGYQAQRVARQAERANREAESARQVSEFLVDLFEVSDPYGTGPDEERGGEITARELLDRGAEKIEKNLRDQPEIQARLMNTMGVVYKSRSLYEAAVPLLEKALALRRRIHGDEHVEVAESLGEMADLLAVKGDYEAAEPLFRQSLAMRRRLLGDEHLELAKTLDDLAAVLALQGDYEAAEPFHREALATYRRLLGDEHPKVAWSLTYLAWSLNAQGNHQAAEPLCREALAMSRRLHGQEHPNVAVSLTCLASLLRVKGDLEAAEPLQREALAMWRQLMGNEHPAVASCLVDLAEILLVRGEVSAAESRVREAQEIYRQVLPPGHHMVLNAESLLGAVLTRRGRYEDAEPLLIDAYLALRDTRSERARTTRDALRRIVDLYEAWGRPEKAAEYRALQR